MLEVLLPLALLGALIVSLDRLVRRGQTSSHLPSHRLSRPVFTKPGWSVELNRLSISIYTKALNDLPSQITRTLPRHVTRLYDIGAIVGIVGVAGAVFSGLWAVKDVWATVWLEAGLHAGETIIKGDEKAVNLLRRAMNNIAPVGDNGEQSGLAPLIPGVTVPLSHFPTIVLALVANQLFHELGHALSASYDGMSPSRLSFSLHYLLPSMIVSFPKSVDRAAVKVRLRLASAGSWHNLITYISIWSLALGGLGSIWWSDLSDVGRVVLSVDPASPLHGHLKPGQLITHLDEVPIGNRGEDIWSGYLRSSESPDPDRGWCILSKSFEGLPLAPCADHAGIAFVPINPEPPVTDQSHCLNPHLVLEIPSAQCPCPGDKWTCVRPHADENVLRIQLEGSKNGRGNFVLWSGDRQTVLEDVVVGTTKPIIFDSLVRWVALFIQYMSTIAFSLFIFNLLPLPSADGSHVFRAVLDLMPSRTPSPRTTPVPTQKPFQATLSSVTTAASPVYTSSSRLNSPNVPTSSRLNTPTISMFRQFELHSDDDDSDDGDGDYESDEENTGGRGIGRRSKEGAWKSKLRRGVEMGTMGIAGAWAAGWAMLALLRSS